MQNEFCWHISCRDLRQNLRHSSLGIPRSASSSRTVITHLCWLQLVLVQHSQVFHLFQAFQNVDDFQQIIHPLWSVCATLLFVLHSLPSSLKAFWIIQIVSMEECSSLTQNLMQIRWSTCSVILNAVATQYTCSLNGPYHPHWLVSTVKSSLFTHVHSSPLSLAARLYRCYTNSSCY